MVSINLTMRILSHIAREVGLEEHRRTQEGGETTRPEITQCELTTTLFADYFRREDSRRSYGNGLTEGAMKFLERRWMQISNRFLAFQVDQRYLQHTTARAFWKIYDLTGLPSRHRTLNVKHTSRGIRQSMLFTSHRQTDSQRLHRLEKRTLFRYVQLLYALQANLLTLEILTGIVKLGKAFEWRVWSIRPLLLRNVNGELQY